MRTKFPTTNDDFQFLPTPPFFSNLLNFWQLPFSPIIGKKIFSLNLQLVLDFCTGLWYHYIRVKEQNRKERKKMENTSLKMALLTKYHIVAFTDKYILGFIYKGNIYITYANAQNLERFIKLDIASRGQGYSIRFKPSASDKIYLLTMGAKVLCSVKYFNELVETTKYNRGEILEKLVTELEAGKVWEKDNIPFTEAGDVEINGIPYQVKFEKATFTNEKAIESLMAKAGK